MSTSRWFELGRGSFNIAKISPNPVEDKETGRTVYLVEKEPQYKKYQSSAVDLALIDPIRACKIWNEINPTLPAHQVKSFWQMPYVAGTKPTDAEIAEKILEQYRKTGYLCVDAYNSKRENFIKTAENEIVCIDVDLALHLEDPASKKYYNEVLIPFFYLYREHFASHAASGMEKTVSVIRSLLKFELHRLHSPEPISREQFLYDELRQELNLLEDTSFTSTQVEMKDIEEDRLRLLPNKEYKNHHPHLSTERSIFTRLHAKDMWFFSSTRTKACKTDTALAMHAQKSKRWFNRDVRSTTLMKKLGWLNKNNEVIRGSGLDRALRLENHGNDAPEIVYEDIPAYKLNLLK